MTAAGAKGSGGADQVAGSGTGPEMTSVEHDIHHVSSVTSVPLPGAAGFGSLSMAFGQTLAMRQSITSPNSSPNPTVSVADATVGRATLMSGRNHSLGSLASPLKFSPEIGLNFRGSRGIAASRFIPHPLTLLGVPPTPRRRPEAAAARRTALLWFRSDLRLHDNEALDAALREASSVVPVFCFDPRDYGKNSAGFEKTGAYRAQFVLQAVADLRERLRGVGSELVVRIGKPEEVLARIIRDVSADVLFCHTEVTAEDAAVQARVEAAVKGEGAKFHALWGSTLYHKEDLPSSDIPSTYAAFRAMVANLAVRKPEDAPRRAKGMPLGCGLDPGSVPTLAELGVSGKVAAGGKGFPGSAALIGGETEALRQMEQFFKDVHRGKAQQQPQKGKTGAPSVSAQNGAGANFSCKISPWLALGCLSPRLLYQKVAAHNKGGASRRRVAGSKGARGSTAEQLAKSGLSWFVFELTWRDFFRFTTHKAAAAATAAHKRATAKEAPALAAC